MNHICLKIGSEFHIFLSFEQDYVTNIDFDYMEYARQRFMQYWLKKPQLLKAKTVISQINDLVPEESKKNGVTTHAT